MSEQISINHAFTKPQKYAELLPQITALIQDEKDLTANLANIASALKYGMDFFWVGFYRVADQMLVLGPFQGTVACTRIPFGKGVCGTAYTQKATILVPNVDDFQGHIACSAASKSEIVVPILKNGEPVLILDVDSNKYDDFDLVDKKYLEELAQMISKIC